MGQDCSDKRITGMSLPSVSMLPSYGRHKLCMPSSILHMSFVHAMGRQEAHTVHWHQNGRLVQDVEQQMKLISSMSHDRASPDPPDPEHGASSGFTRHISVHADVPF